MGGNTEATSSALLGLRALVAPPISGGNTIDWVRMVDDYGHDFPDDYRAFMEVYGGGVFDDFLSVQPPVSEVYIPSTPVRGETDTARYTAEMEDFDEPELLIA